MQRTYLNVVGSFEAVVETPEAGWFGEKGENNTPFIRIPVVVSEDGPEKGCVAVWYGWLSEKAIDNTIATLAKVFNFNGDLAALHQGKVTLVGMQCNITTEKETYEGKERTKVAWLNPPGGGEAKPMEEVKVKSLLAKLNSRSKAIAKAQTAATGPNPPARVPSGAMPQNPNQPPAEDDPPF